MFWLFPSWLSLCSFASTFSSSLLSLSSSYEILTQRHPGRFNWNRIYTSCNQREAWRGWEFRLIFTIVLYISEFMSIVYLLAVKTILNHKLPRNLPTTSSVLAWRVQIIFCLIYGDVVCFVFYWQFSVRGGLHMLCERQWLYGR